MPAAPELARSQLISFDGGVGAEVLVQRPERYRQIETPPRGARLIPRGGGYSYAAASFGTGCVTQDMCRFDRVLAFDAQAGTIVVEAGITLGKLLAFIVPRGYWLSQLPGYPEITVGGAIAGNVHGKNPLRDGTFRQCVLAVRLYHTAHGWITASAGENAEAFDLTVGGFGLTGTIVSATLKLRALAGGAVRTRSSPIRSIGEGLSRLQDAASSGSDFSYTWHDGHPARARFGRGLLMSGAIEPGSPVEEPFVRRYRTLPPMPSAGRLPVAVWGGWRTAALNMGYLAACAAFPGRGSEGLFDSLFPLAAKHAYFRLYGAKGLIESQIAVPLEHAAAFVEALEQAILRHAPPVVFLSLKAMGGTQTLLRFEGSGFGIALNMVRNAKALSFMPMVDELVMKFRSLPSLIKDSRLPRTVVERCYPQLGEFRRRLAQYDPQGSYSSELAQRLGLCGTS